MAARKPKRPDISGYTKLDTDVDRFPKHDCESDGFIAGQVLKKRNQTVKDKDGNPRDTRLMIVATEAGERIFWENANLETFFDDVSPGDRIFVEFKGWQELSGNRRMKLFDAYHAPGEL